MISAVSAILLQATNVLGIVNRSIDAVWWEFAFSLVWATSLLIATKLLIQYGAIGLATSYCIAYLIHLIVSGLYLKLRFRRLINSND